MSWIELWMIVGVAYGCIFGYIILEYMKFHRIVRESEELDMRINKALGEYYD